MTNETSPKPRRSKWRTFALEALLLVAVVTGIRLWQQRDMVSGIAPVLQGVTLAGQRYSLPAHPLRPVLVHFWATWCPVCRMEQDGIADIAGDGHEVISIAMQSGKAEEVAAYAKKQGITLPVINDADGSLSSAWGVHAVPASFIIAPDGQIQFVEVGYTTEIGIRLRMWWAGT
ncbi:MAG: protein disulfide oxidoreductase [Nitrosomonadales bacterium]|nr:protein disulfide oxidoreductase [Nitrosomonadales bacterium]